MTRARPRLRRSARAALAAAVTAVLLLSAAPPAAAHATLVDTDPVEGAVLPTVPSLVRFTFDESVATVPEGVQVFDARGRTIDSSSITSDTDLLVTLEGEVPEGTLVVAWRVVSADGHPVSGSLTFSVGAPSEGVPSTPSSTGAANPRPVALSLSRWPAYAGLLLAVGLVWFSTLLVPPGLSKVERARGRLRATARSAAAVGVVGWLVGIPLTAVYIRGSDLTSAFEQTTWAALRSDEIAVTVAVLVALVASVCLLPRQATSPARATLACVAGLLALAPLPLSGHTRADAQAELVIVADWLHLVVGAVWLGGLVGLAIVVPALAGRHDAAAVLVSRFSTYAAGVLAALISSGAFLAWRIVGSWSALVSTDYGRLLLVKIGFVAVAVVIAAYNRFRMVPRIRTATGFQDRAATARTLARTVTVEAGALVVVLLVTGFLVNTSPPAPAATSSHSATKRTDLGDLQAVVTLTPADVGMNTLTLRLQDVSGEPASDTEPPRVRITSDDVGGDVPLTRTGPGTFQGRVVIPREGTWAVQVSLRLSRFDNPVATVSFQVGSHAGHG